MAVGIDCPTTPSMMQHSAGRTDVKPSRCLAKASYRGAEAWPEPREALSWTPAVMAWRTAAAMSASTSELRHDSWLLLGLRFCVKSTYFVAKGND